MIIIMYKLFNIDILTYYREGEIFLRLPTSGRARLPQTLFKFVHYVHIESIYMTEVIQVHVGYTLYNMVSIGMR